MTTPTTASGGDETLTFQVSAIVFAREGFHIVRTAGGDSVKGKFAAREGYFYQATGKWDAPNKFGCTFLAESAIAITPSTAKGLVRFLAIALKGKKVGESVLGALAEACTDEGLNLEEMLDKAKRDELIDCVGSRNAKKIDILLAEWPKLKPGADLVSPLLGYGLSPAQADQLVALYGKNAVKLAEDDPYSLILLLDGVSFLTADRIAMKTGLVKKTDPTRLRAALSVGIRDATSSGDVGVRRKTLIDKTMPLVNESILENGRRKLAPGVDPVVSPQLLSEQLQAMLDAKIEEEKSGEPELAESKSSFSRMLIEAEDEKGEAVIWYRPLWDAEKDIARRLATFSAPIRRDLLPLVPAMALELGYSLEPEQQQAVETALVSPVCVITGGPGTGKSYLLKVLLKVFDAAGLKGYQVAPTGKAAKRIAEATGRPAQTVHSLIGWTGGSFCAFDETIPLPAQYMVIDEASMADTELLAMLLKACPDGCLIIIVGDVDQLPSVGPGQVLRDIIRSGLIPTVRLTKARRFSGGIAKAASQVKIGEVPESTDDGQFIYIDTETPAEDLLAAAKELLGRRVDADEIQVLAPVRKGEAGCVALNGHMQALFNPEPPGPKTMQRLRRDEGDIRVGDRAIQCRNDKELKIVNGDVGYIEGIESGSGNASFKLPDRDEPVRMGRNQSDNLQLAYAITVHKSQGAEASYVLIALDPGATFMLTRALVYTAITRGKTQVRLFASRSTFTRAVKRGEPAEGSRRTALLPKLVTAFTAAGRAPAPASAPPAKVKTVSGAAAVMLAAPEFEESPF